MRLHVFVHTIQRYYQANKRLFAWRDCENPYYVLVSEIMLQQTQTHRVAPKFETFIELFPDLPSLAAAPLGSVLAAWQGLGYNRRARFLHAAAQEMVASYGGRVPDDPAVLVQLPGIGRATAASIAAFAYNKPTVFIETNVRAVFLHFFFPGKEKVDDKELLPLVQASLEGQDPRQWYYALMDYGVMLKKTTPNPSRQSKHHVKQSTFKGSTREVRGSIVRMLTRLSHTASEDFLRTLVQEDIGRSVAPTAFYRILVGLVKDRLVQEQQGHFFLAS